MRHAASPELLAGKAVTPSNPISISISISISHVHMVSSQGADALEVLTPRLHSHPVAPALSCQTTRTKPNHIHICLRRLAK